MFHRSNFNVSHSAQHSQKNIESSPSSLTRSMHSALFSGSRGNFQKQLHSTSTNPTEHAALQDNRFKFPWSGKKDKLKGISITGLNSSGKLGAAIKPNTETWLVIHGWNPEGRKIEGDKTTLNLAKAIDGADRDDQVLVLDWKADAKSHRLNPRQAASKITAVAEAAVKKLDEAGIKKSQLNLVGHSMGGYVVSDIAHSFGRVNRLVALDPASHLINTGTGKGYLMKNVNYSRVSRYAWGFYGSALGYDQKAKTADDSFEVFFLVNGKPRGGINPNPSPNHKDVATGFTHVLERINNGTADRDDRLFNLNTMGSGGEPWANTNNSWNKGPLGLNKGFDAGIEYELKNNNWLIKQIKTS